MASQEIFENNFIIDIFNEDNLEINIEESSVIEVDLSGGLYQVQVDYNQVDVNSVDYIKNKPTINNVTVTGNLTLDELGIITSVNGYTSGDIELTTSDITEGVNLYYTDNRVDSRVILNTEVLKGVSAYGWGNHALAGYANDATVVHTQGDELIYGKKLFEDTVYTVGKLNVGSISFDEHNPEFVKIDSGDIFSVNVLGAYGNCETYLQLNIKNRGNGYDSSSDLVATADIGDENAYYIDMGINCSNYADEEFTITGPLDSYLYSSGGHLCIGTDTESNYVKIFTEGTLAENLRMTISQSSIECLVDITSPNLSGNNTGDETKNSIISKLGTVNSIEGSRGDNEALASLLTALQDLGLIIDNTIT